MEFNYQFVFLFKLKIPKILENKILGKTYRRLYKFKCFYFCLY